ncbi:MAG: SCP2 sterol-binding domain-containing protein [Myxococcales bacterium]|jgi:alkyl sulfatase BDS1-like metallo-beta-lactamase superfamily hydrolase|nr:SCP2 sterol-binding domain-containing protein [Myxococcales bacterium]
MAGIPTSASDLFDNILPASIAKNPAAAQQVGAVYVFKISGEGGGEWTVDLKSSPPGISKGVKDQGVECTIEVTNADFVSMLQNPNLGMQLFMQGKLRVSGNPMLAMKLQNLFKLSAV